MSIPEVTALSPEELRELIDAANAQFQRIEAQRASDAQARRASIGSAILSLETLLGAKTGDPGIDSIRAVRRYDAATMEQHAGLSLDLTFAALEQLTETVLNLARVVSADNA